MDFFGKDQYKELLEVQKGPAVSIFVKIDRQNNKGTNNKLAFGDQVERAKRLLEERYPDEEFRPVAQMMEQWLDEEPFWGELSKGVAAFFSPQMERVYRLSSEVENETVVSDTFHTRPMLRSLLAPQRYWVLVLDRNDTRLYEATESSIRQISMRDIPTNLDDALQLDFESMPNRDREQGAANPQGSPSGVSGSKPGFHSKGNVNDLEPRYLREFSRAVDRGLCNLLENSSGPLILTAPEKLQALYRQESKLPHLADEGLAESLVHLKPPKIHQKTLPLVEKEIDKKIDQVLELWEREYGKGKGETDLQQIARRTIMSQVRILLIEDGRHIWGNLDRDEGSVSVTRDVQPGDTTARGDRSAEEADLLDELAEFVIARGGEVYVLPKNRMPTNTGAAAILRGLGGAAHGGEKAVQTD